MIVDAVIVAAGRGTRLPGPTPKQFRMVGGRSVLSRTVDAFEGHRRVRRTLLVVGADDGPLLAEALPGHTLPTAVGGETRQASVANGLTALEADAPDAVLIHDGARPFVSAAVIDRVIDALGHHAAAIPTLPVADTIKRVGADGVIAGTVARTHLHQAQTPQGFHFRALLNAHAAAPDGVTDDAAVMEAAGAPVAVVPGERANYKITTMDDLHAAERACAPMPVIGQGFDVHRLVPGGPMILGGVTLDVDTRLDGHSDADVALHALTDALFGALADGDIGSHFPPSDDTWKGAASDRFLAFAAERAKAVGEIGHLDLTIICERPKIGPHRQAMRVRIAKICGVPVCRVAVKATTTERLGFTGRGEGIAAQAVATIWRR